MMFLVRKDEDTDMHNHVVKMNKNNEQILISSSPGRMEAMMREKTTTTTTVNTHVAIQNGFVVCAHRSLFNENR